VPYDPLGSAVAAEGLSICATVDVSEEKLRVSKVWRHPQQLGSFTLIPFMGATPVAIFLGFSLTVAITVAESNNGNNLWKQASLILFGLATLALVLCLQWIVHAGQWVAGPDLRLMMRPEAKVDPRVLNEVRSEWSQDLMLLSWYVVWISRSLTIGLSCAVAAFGCALLAFSDRLGNQVSAGITILTVLALILSYFSTRRPFPERSWARAQLGSGSPSPLNEAGWAAMFGGVLEAQLLQVSPARTLEELTQIAHRDEIEPLFVACAQLLIRRSDRHYTTAVSLVGEVLVGGNYSPAVSLHLGGSTPGKLMFSVSKSLFEALAISEDQFVSRLPLRSHRHPTLGWYGFISHVAEFDQLLPERSSFDNATTKRLKNSASFGQNKAYIDSIGGLVSRILRPK
jgi:hypothetical protein